MGFLLTLGLKMDCMRKFFAILLILSIGLPSVYGATKKKITDPDEALEKAREAYLGYDVEQAREMFDEYSALMKKKKKTVPDEVEAEMSRVVLMENMLSRVERIVIVDTIEVDAEGFFRHYRLSPEAGRLVGGEAIRMPEVEVAYVPQNNSELLYADVDTAGVFRLMGADVLDDGTVDHPSPLEGEDLSGGGNAEYPFLMSDGLTLYYANDGEGSIGGYDIFLTRRDDDGTFLQPQNIGMPYNSPFDDYLLAIDETTGAGWWATDRNQIPGKVTIYVFMPSETRVNVEADDENLISLARLDDIELTRNGANVTAVKSKIEGIKQDSGTKNLSGAEFELFIGDTGKVYTTLSDFRSSRARQAMARAIDARVEIRRIETRLDELRLKWAKGDKSNGITILNLEQQLQDARDRLAEATNQAIAEETGR